MTAAVRACDRCLSRSWLLARLAGHLDLVRGRIEPVLRLDDEELITAVAGKQQDAVRRQRSALDVGGLRRTAASAGVHSICRCDPEYPARLALAPSRPAVLYVSGGLKRFLELMAGEPVAIVGARRASAYGLEVARSLGRGLGCAGITVLSGMALGIDSAAHAGALAAGAPTVAVLPGGADRPYPPSRRSLLRQIQTHGAAVSELPPGANAWRWAFPARNRIIAGLSAMTVVVEAGERSGALLTAAFANDLSRAVGAVPGRVSAPLSHGPLGLLADGAQLVRGPQDVLDQLYGAGVRSAPRDDRPELSSELGVLLAAIAEGHDSAASLAQAGFAAERCLGALVSLELAGYVRRAPGGRFVVVP
ncbi:MAG: DNA-processing protein DprA [Solirubrobacteraceae bacterium]